MYKGFGKDLWKATKRNASKAYKWAKKPIDKLPRVFNRRPK